MHICVTRFNNSTYLENINYKKKNNIIGSIYGSPVKIKDYIDPHEIILIIEMNNSINKIEGIGIIKNKIDLTKKYKIYSDNNYNRFIYKSNLHISKDSFTSYENKFILYLEKLLFTSCKHCKRGHGIQSLPLYIKNNNSIYNFDFNKFIINMYSNRFININLNNNRRLKIVNT